MAHFELELEVLMGRVRGDLSRAHFDYMRATEKETCSSQSPSKTLISRCNVH